MSQSNSLGLLGRKVGMMRLFTDDGDAVPVTVVDVSNNRVTQVKTPEADGYVGLQVTFGARKASRVTKPAAGHLAKAGVEAGEIIREFRIEADVAGHGIAADRIVRDGARILCPDRHADVRLAGDRSKLFIGDGCRIAEERGGAARCALPGIRERRTSQEEQERATRLAQLHHRTPSLA